MARLMKPAPSHPLWVDVTIGLSAGLAATLVTNLAQHPLSRVTPEWVHRQEKRVRPGASSSLVAGQKLCEAMHLDPSPRQHEMSGKAIHLATGMGWGPVYLLLRRYAGLRPFPAALACGTAMSLILDETLVPALGLSAPNHRYPAFTRLRGLAAHLVYGAAVAVVAEGLGTSVMLARGVKPNGTAAAHDASTGAGRGPGLRSPLRPGRDPAGSADRAGGLPR